MPKKSLLEMSLSELEEYRKTLSFESFAYARATEQLTLLRLQQASQPHWSVIPMFWVAVIAAIAGCIAAYPVVFPSETTITPTLPASRSGR